MVGLVVDLNGRQMADSLYSLLGSTGGGLEPEEKYLSQDPFFTTGLSIAKMQLPQAETSGQAWFGPLIQGLLSGSAMGYGRERARQNEYQDISGMLSGMPRDNIVGPLEEKQVYGLESAPDDWTYAGGRGDLIKRLSIQENQQKLADAIALAEATSPYKNQTASGRALSESERSTWATRLKLSPEEALSLTTAGDVDRFMRAKGLSGEKVRPPSTTEINQITQNDNFRDRIGNLRSLAKQLDDNSLVRATQGGKVMQWFGDTESKDYQFYAQLKAAQQEYARAKDSGALSTFDVKLWGPLFEGLPLLDSKKAIADRLEAIDNTIKKAKVNQLDNLEKGLVNITGYEGDRETLRSQLAAGSGGSQKQILDQIPPGYELDGTVDAAGNKGLRRKR